MKSIQIINKRVNVDKLDGRYYSKLKNEIRKQVRENPEILLINFLPNRPVTELWALMTLLDLQLEFTDTVIIPRTTIDAEQLDEWVCFFDPKQVLKCNL